MKKVSKLLELFIGDEVIVDEDRRFIDRRNIKPTEFNTKGLILYRYNEDEMYNLGIRQETFEDVNRWCPMDYYEFCDGMYQLVHQKFPTYEIKRVDISGYMEFNYSIKIKKDDECLAN
jgi:hypothetical protein